MMANEYSSVWNLCIFTAAFISFIGINVGANKTTEINLLMTTKTSTHLNVIKEKQASSTHVSTTESFIAVPSTSTESKFGPTPLMFYYEDLFYITGPDYLESSDIVLSSLLTQDFLSRYSNELKVQVLKQQLQFCPYQGLCNFSWPDTLQQQPSTVFCCDSCSCDTGCLERMNCCPDMLKDNLYDLNYKPVFKQCVATYLKNTLRGVQAYSSCPADVSIELQRNCTRPYEDGSVTLEDIIPVTDENRVTYRNRYCAQCSHLNAKDLKLWFPRLECVNASSMSVVIDDTFVQSVFQEQYCDISYIPPILEIAPACTPLISSCNVTGLWSKFDESIEWACSFYLSPLRSANGSYFQNVFCMLCNGHLAMKTFCSTSNGQISADKFSFAAVLNVEKHKVVDKNQMHSCPPGTIPAMGNCVPAHCSFLRTLRGNQCVRTIQSVVTVTYTANMRMIPVQPMTTETAYRLVQSLFGFAIYLLRFTLYGNPIVQVIEVFLTADVLYNVGITSSALENTSLKYYDIRIDFRLENDVHDPEKILTDILKINGHEQELRVNQEIVLLYTYVKDDTGRTFDRIEEVGSLAVDPGISFNNSDVVLENVLQISKFNTEGEALRLPFLYPPGAARSLLLPKPVKLLSLRSCPLVPLPYESMPWTENIDRLLFTNHKTELNFTDYIYDPDKVDVINICIEKYTGLIPSSLEVSDGLQQSMAPDTVMSLLCVSLSITALLVTVGNFCYFPAFKTLPWKNNLCLTTSLLLAHIFYVVGSYGELEKNSLTCKAIGIAIHFFFLMSIHWMNICTFNMFRVLTRARPVAKTAEWKKFFLYIVYNIFISITCVSINIAYSLVTTNYSSIGYGHAICYINSQNMVLYTFGIPLAFVVITNLLMVGRIMCTLKATPVIRKNVTNERNLLLIFTKLTVITGLTWVFGLMYMLTNIIVFSYLFIIFTGSQGVFLMISFLCNGNVLAMYKSRLSRFSSSSKDSRQ